MQEILVLGDSLTWGADPQSGARHPYPARLPSVLSEGLGDNVHVVADGLGGRNTSFNDFSGPCDRNASRTLPVLLGTHQPLDVVVIMLGTNDLKPYICGLASGAAAGMKRLIQIVKYFPYKSGKIPKILVVAPPPCVAGPGGAPAQNRSIAESQALAPAYRALAEAENVAFFDARQICSASPIDGVHLSAEDTIALGQALILPVKALLEQ